MEINKLYTLLYLKIPQLSVGNLSTKVREMIRQQVEAGIEDGNVI
jgi:hypothetical protein